MTRPYAISVHVTPVQHVARNGARRRYATLAAAASVAERYAGISGRSVPVTFPIERPDGVHDRRVVVEVAADGTWHHTPAALEGRHTFTAAAFDELMCAGCSNARSWHPADWR
jgi:hypothetical protein